MIMLFYDGMAFPLTQKKFLFLLNLTQIFRGGGDSESIHKIRPQHQIITKKYHALK